MCHDYFESNTVALCNKNVLKNENKKLYPIWVFMGTLWEFILKYE